MPAVLVFPGRLRPAPVVRVHPSEDGVRVTFRYAVGDLPGGALLESAAATALRLSDNEDSTGDVLSLSGLASVSLSGLEVYVDVSGAGAADGERHRVTIESALVGGGTIVDQFVLRASVGPVD